MFYAGQRKGKKLIALFTGGVQTGQVLEVLLLKLKKEGKNYLSKW